MVPKKKDIYLSAKRRRDQPLTCDYWLAQAGNSAGVLSSYSFVAFGTQGR